MSWRIEIELSKAALYVLQRFDGDNAVTANDLLATPQQNVSAQDCRGDSILPCMELHIHFSPCLFCSTAVMKAA